MRLQPLYDLQQEINRLFIAGSKFAKGDLRLQKQVPVFNKLGEKAPVFVKLAKDIEDLISADSQQSAAKLTAISTLLYSILYTQGETFEADMDIREQAPLVNISDVNTEYSYLQLHPVIEALSTSSSGRLEILKDAKDAGFFSDSRTYQYVDLALADKYSELAEYVEKEICQAIGKPMLPFLLRNFRYEDKTAHTRRLRLLGEFGYSDMPVVINRILSESLPALQAEVVMIMSKDPSNEEIITSLTKDKNKIVREAAYKALANIGTKSAMEQLNDVLIKAKDKMALLYFVSPVLASSKSPYLFENFFAQAKDAYEDFLNVNIKGAESVLFDKLERFRLMLDILSNKNEQVVEDFYMRVLSDKKFFELIIAKKTLFWNVMTNMIKSISQAVSLHEDEHVIAFYERNMDNVIDNPWIEILWKKFFFAAEKMKWPKEKMYARFHPVYKKGYLSVTNLYNAFTDGKYHCYYYSDLNNSVVYKDRVDLRWLEELYNIFDSSKKLWGSYHNEALVILDACEPKPKKFYKLLESSLKYTQPSIQVVIFKYIMKYDFSDKFDIIFSTIEKYPKTVNNYEYVLSYLSNIGIWTQFPKKYGEKFRKLGEKAKQDVFGEIADEILKTES